MRQALQTHLLTTDAMIGKVPEKKAAPAMPGGGGGYGGYGRHVLKSSLRQNLY